jgi:hypothetical protein
MFLLRQQKYCDILVDCGLYNVLCCVHTVCIWCCEAVVWRSSCVTDAAVHDTYMHTVTSHALA